MRRLSSLSLAATHVASDTAVTPARDRKFIEARNVRKSFGAVPVLRSINFDVRRGQVVALLGPSGSGKSTMLRCINFTERYDDGEILIDGRQVGYEEGTRQLQSEREIAKLRSEVGIVFQSYNLFPHLNVISNITLGPIHVKGVPRREAEEFALDLLDKVGVREKANEYPIRLSGGQQQRVAIARALAMKPKAVLFDEVTSALDPELVDEVLNVMRALAADGLTMVVVTHEIQFARDIAGQVVFLDGGMVTEQGAPDEVLGHPKTPRLQAFLRRYAR